MSRHILEKYRIFPFIAWLFLIITSLLIYFFVDSIKNKTENIDSRSIKLEKNLEKDVLEIDFFEARN